jgi:hypothetical protein
MTGGKQGDVAKQKVEHAPGVIIHVTDQGATSPDPTPCDLDLEPSSALGGGSSTRSNTRPTPDPAEHPVGALTLHGWRPLPGSPDGPLQSS